MSYETSVMLATVIGIVMSCVLTVLLVGPLWGGIFMLATAAILKAVGFWMRHT